MLKYARTRAVNAIHGFFGATSLKAMGASARTFGRGLSGYGRGAIGGYKVGQASRAYRNLSMGGRRLGSQLGGYFSGRDMRGMSRMGQYSVGAGRAGLAMGAADFLNPFGLGFND